MSTHSIGGGGGSSRHHPYSRSHHHHHRSSREEEKSSSRRSREVSRSSRDSHHRSSGSERIRLYRHDDGHHSEGSRRRDRYGHRHDENVESRVSSLAIPRLQSTEERIRIFSTAQQTYNEPINMICSAIEGARSQVVLKIYHITSERIISSLVKQSHKVPVSIHYQDSFNLAALTAGSSIVLDKRASGAILHKKTLLVDNSLVVSGSANYTDPSLIQDINFTLRMRGSSLCNIVSSNTRGVVDVGSQRVKYYPLSRVRHRAYKDHHLPITSEINEAKSNILVAMYAFSQLEILMCLEQAITRGVKVKVITDKKEVSLLQNITQGKKVRSCIYVYDQIDNGDYSGLFHAKACCIDSRVLLCGSANWTSSGLNKNLEDLFVISPLTERQIQCFSEAWAFFEERSEPAFPDSALPSTSSSSLPQTSASS